MRAAALLSLLVLSSGCPDSAGKPGMDVSQRVPDRARRAFEGAPPLVPHPPLGADCVSCHTRSGMEIEGVGAAPALPHARTPGLSAESRCQMCHVFRTTEDIFVESDFSGFRRARSEPLPMQGSPPGIPHPLHMHEDCLSCHNGLSSRATRTTHPERSRCVQCHVPRVGATPFQRRGAD